MGSIGETATMPTALSSLTMDCIETRRTEVEMEADHIVRLTDMFCDHPTIFLPRPPSILSCLITHPVSFPSMAIVNIPPLPAALVFPSSRITVINLPIRLTAAYPARSHHLACRISWRMRSLQIPMARLESGPALLPSQAPRLLSPLVTDRCDPWPLSRPSTRSPSLQHPIPRPSFLNIRISNICSWAACFTTNKPPS